MGADLIEADTDDEYLAGRLPKAARLRASPNETSNIRKHRKTEDRQGSTSDEERLLGRSSRPDPNAIAIAPPGIGGSSRKSGPFKPVDTLTRQPRQFSRSISSDLLGQPPHRLPPSNLGRHINDIRQGSRYGTPSTSDRAWERPSKRRRLEEPETKTMSREQPIVLDDDEDDGEVGTSHPVVNHLSSKNFGRLNGPKKFFSSTSSSDVSTKGLNNTQSRPNGGTPTVRDPVRAEKHPPLNVPAKVNTDDTTDEELFTKAARRSRVNDNSQRAAANSSPPKTTHINGSITAGRNATHSAPEPSRNHSTTTPRSVLESPDALQMPGTTVARNATVRHDSKMLGTPNRSNDAVGTTRSPHNRMATTQSGLQKIPAKSVSRGLQHASSKEYYRLEGLVYGHLIEDYKYNISINHIMKTLVVDAVDCILEDDPMAVVPLKLLLRIYHGENCAVLNLQFAGSDKLLDTQAFLRFESHGTAISFIQQLQELDGTLDVIARKDDWLLRASDHRESRLTKHREQASSTRVPRKEYTKHEAVTSPHFADKEVSNKVRTKLKLVEQLQTSGAQAASGLLAILQKPVSAITGRNCQTEGAGTLTLEQREPSSEASEDANRANKTLSRFVGPARTTRSRSTMRDNATTAKAPDHRLIPPKPKFSETGGLGPPWKKPLVYPKVGKKRETVDFQDLQRLDDDEFLNDNLIGFFLRYLEHHLEQERPELARRIYFFNSYFYDSLSKREKGMKGINFDAVKKWTRNVDIFSRDFIIVPVNENFHWYLAIICNLPALRRTLPQDGTDEAETTQANSQEVEAVEFNGLSEGEEAKPVDVDLDEPNGETRSSFAEMTLNETNNDLSTSDPVQHGEEIATSQSSPKTRKGPGRRKSVRRSLPKLDPLKPVIITLDSLGVPHSATRTALKQYIVEEGREKRSMDIDQNDIKGVTAKGIPMQRNYSDCGIFVCAYMERFVTDPQQFVKEILLREVMSEERQWPMMNMDDLRSRLRELIMELHRLQEKEGPVLPIPRVGEILLRSAPDLPVRSKGDHHSDDDEQNSAAASSQIHHELEGALHLSSAASKSEEQTFPPSPSERGADDLPSALAILREPSSRRPARTPEAPIEIPDDTPTAPDSSDQYTRANVKHSQSSLKDDFVDYPSELGGAQPQSQQQGRISSPARSESVTTEYNLNPSGSYLKDLPGSWQHEGEEDSQEELGDEIRESQRQTAGLEPGSEQEILEGI